MRRNIIITLLVAAIAIIIGMTRAEATQRPFIPESTPVPFVVDARLLQLGRDLGISEGELQTCHASVIHPNQAVDVSGEISAFDPNTRTIDFYPEMFGRSLVEQRLTLAHEYMHCVWDRKTVAEKASLSSYLEGSYNNNADIRARLADYDLSDPDTKDSELHSYLCTEVSDYRLGASFLHYCSQYLPNRAVLISTL